MENTINNKRKFAKITGYSLLIMAIAAGFSLGFAFPKFFKQIQLQLAQTNITQNLPLYKQMIAGLIIVFTLDLVVSYSLYKYFKNDHKNLAIFTNLLRIVYTILFGNAIFYLSKNIVVTNNDFILENHQLFQTLWSIGLIVFGLHLLGVGLLMKLHKLIPKALWILTIIAGFSYTIIHFIKTFFPHLTELIDTLNMVLLLPMTLGEIGLAIWLIIKGGKTKKLSNNL